MVHVTTPKPPVQLIFSAARVSCRNPIAFSSCARARLPASIAWTPPAVIRSAVLGRGVVTGDEHRRLRPDGLGRESGVEGGVARFEHVRGRPTARPARRWPSSLTLNPEAGRGVAGRVKHARRHEAASRSAAPFHSAHTTTSSDRPTMTPIIAGCRIGYRWLSACPPPAVLAGVAMCAWFGSRASATATGRCASPPGGGSPCYRAKPASAKMVHIPTWSSSSITCVVVIGYASTAWAPRSRAKSAAAAANTVLNPWRRNPTLANTHVSVHQAGRGSIAPTRPDWSDPPSVLATLPAKQRYNLDAWQR